MISRKPHSAWFNKPSGNLSLFVDYWKQYNTRISVQHDDQYFKNSVLLWGIWMTAEVFVIWIWNSALYDQKRHACPKTTLSGNRKLSNHKCKLNYNLNSFRDRWTHIFVCWPPCHLPLLRGAPKGIFYLFLCALVIFPIFANGSLLERIAANNWLTTCLIFK